MSMITARQRVLGYLKKQRSASAAQIGRGLNMSAADVRYHLSIMLGDGRVALISEKRRAGRGRPVKLYGLSEKSLGDNFALLSDAVLGELLNGLSPVKRDGMLNAIAKTLAIQFDTDNLNIPMTKQLAIIVDKLNELHYQARWEAGPQGPRILFAHCPYAAIIEKHPELCRMDEFLVGNLMNAKACQLAKIGQPPIGSPYCVFGT
jgi:predicted ArsR family transcriptional regulator